MNHHLGHTELVGRLPLPLAELLVRALNAKSAVEQHHCAFYLGEAALRLAAVASVSHFRASATDDAARHQRILDLERPSFGTLLVVHRELGGDEPPLAGGREALAATRVLADRLVELDVLQAAARRQARGGHRGLFQLLVAYRNQVMGHGAQRVRSYYEDVGPLLLAAVTEALQPGWAGGRELAVCSGGAWSRLMGTAELPMDAPFEGPDGSVWLLGAQPPLRLDPFLTHHVEPRLGTLRVVFLNRVVRRSGRVRRTDYLDYASGESVVLDRYADVAEVLEEASERGRGSVIEPLPRETTGEVSGDVFGEYVREAVLGEGAMGVVYRAHQLSVRRTVALKVMAARLADDEVARRRFEREIAALARVEHPNVVKVLAAGEADGLPYYAMEFVDGADLGKVFQVLAPWQSSSPVPLSGDHLAAAIDAARAVPAVDDDDLPTLDEKGSSLHERLAALFADAADGLHELHAQGVVHRDLKPSNLMLTHDARRIVVMDLGLARLADASAGLTASDAQFVGTLRYAPPEQVRGGGDVVDCRGDVYALGATLWELVLGQPFLEGRDHAHLMHQILSGERPRPVEVDDQVSPALEAVLVKATARDPDERYASAAELAADLRRVSQGTRVSAPLVRPSRRGWKVALAMGAAVLAVLALSGAWWAFTGREQTVYLPAWELRFDGSIPRFAEASSTPIDGAVHFKVTHRRGKALVVERLNERGHPDVEGLPWLGDWTAPYADSLRGSYQWTRDPMTQRRPVRLELSYAPDGSLAQGELLDAYGKVELQASLSPAADGVEVTFTDGHGAPARNPTNGAFRIRIDGVGTRRERFHWLDDDGQPSPSPGDGSWGELLERDERGRIVTITQLDEGGQPMRPAGRAVQRRYTYGDRRHPHAVTEMENLGFSEQPLPTADGWSRHTVELDERGRPILERLFHDDEPVLGVGSACHGWRVDYADGNAPRRWTCVGLDLAPRTSRYDDGAWAMLEWVLDERGYASVQRELGPDGQPESSDTCNTFATTRDARGSVTEVGCVDSDGAPSRHPLGFATARFEVDRRGNTTTMALFDAEGERVVSKLGFAMMLRRFDERDQVVEERMLDDRQEPVHSWEGVHRITRGYDERGYRLWEKGFDTAGRPVALRGAGVSGERRVVDRHGRELELTYLGADHETPAVNREEGFATRRRTYGPRGAILREAWFGPDGLPMLNEEGVAAVVRTHDANGNVVSEAYEGVDGKPIEDRSGQARKLYTRDARGQVMEGRVVGLTGPAKNRDGCARFTNAFDTWGYRSELRCFDALDQPTPVAWGHEVVRYENTPAGKWASRSFFDHDGERRTNRSGVHREEKVFSATNLVEYNLYGVDDRLVDGPAGWAMHRRRWDGVDLVEKAWFHADGSPARASRRPGYAHRIEYAHDAQGLVVEERMVDVDGGPVGGVQVHRLQRDEQGNIAHESWFGPEGPVAPGHLGWASRSRIYDAAGQIVREATRDVHGDLVANDDGYAVRTSVWDDRGNEVERRLFGTDDEPVLGAAGHAGWQRAYDMRGNIVRETFLGIDHLPMKGPGATGYEVAYDAYDRVVRRTRLGPASEPAPDPGGVVHERIERDRLGNVLHHRFEGVSGLVEGDEGFAERRVRRDEVGAVVLEAYLDARGLPVVGPYGCARRERSDEGLSCLDAEQAAQRPPATL